MIQRFSPRSFTRTKILRKIDPANLFELLRPHKQYLESRGFQFPATPLEEPDYQQLSLILLNPDKRTPLDLTETLHIIANTGTDKQIDRLLEVAISEDVDIGTDEITPVDLAVRIWLKAPGALVKLEQHTVFHKELVFDHFPARMLGAAVSIDQLPHDLTPLERVFDQWFRKNQRGHGVNIQRADTSTEARYLISHGRPRKRVKDRIGFDSRWLYLRPEQTDVVIYDSFRNELRVRATTPGEIRMYVAEFGKYLFGDENFFTFAQKYTLTPLQERGPEALNCRGIEGLDFIRLRDIEWLWPAPSNAVQAYRSADVFDHFRIHRLTIPKQAIIHKATFEVKLVGLELPRLVSIRLPNLATFVRGEEALLIERWLREQGFVLSAVRGNHEEIDENMESF